MWDGIIHILRYVLERPQDTYCYIALPFIQNRGEGGNCTANRGVFAQFSTLRLFLTTIMKEDSKFIPNLGRPLKKILWKTLEIVHILRVAIFPDF
jgi:hypothetical protein